MTNKSIKVIETELQKAVQLYLSDPSKVYDTSEGNKFQILSPGRINPLEGPDFLEIALLLNSKIIIGDAEFHKKSSDWIAHNHSNDSRYNSVVLHIVFENDINHKANFNTLILNESEINKLYFDEILNKKEKKDLFSLEEVQNFALIRLLRKTTEAQKVINRSDLATALQILTNDFINKYQSKRRRPVYNPAKLDSVADSFAKSTALNFLKNISEEKEISIPNEIQNLMKIKVSDEGAALRREIILNVVLPLALTQANEEARINLFVWYWSTPALNKYGVLSRRFPLLPQNFLWQQQGMLEFVNDLSSKSTIISEAVSIYGFGNILNFLQWGPDSFVSND